MRLTFEELARIAQDLCKLKNDETVKKLPEYVEHIGAVEQLIYTILI